MLNSLKDKQGFLCLLLETGVRRCRGMTPKRLTEALDPLMTGGLIRPETRYPDCKAWIVTPGLRDALHEPVQAEGERRRAGVSRAARDHSARRHQHAACGC